MNKVKINASSISVLISILIASILNSCYEQPRTRDLPNGENIDSISVVLPIIELWVHEAGYGPRGYVANINGHWIISKTGIWNADPDSIYLKDIQLSDTLEIAQKEFVKLEEGFSKLLAIESNGVEDETLHGIILTYKVNGAIKYSYSAYNETLIPSNDTIGIDELTKALIGLSNLDVTFDEDFFNRID